MEKNELTQAEIFEKMTKTELINEIRKYGTKAHIKMSKPQLLEILNNLPIDPDKIGKPYEKIEDMIKSEDQDDPDKSIITKKIKELIFTFDAVETENNSLYIQDISGNNYNFKF